MPRARPANSKGRPKLRRARLSDLDALQVLEHSAFRTDRISRRSFRHLLASQHAVAIVADLGGQVVGYALVTLRANSSIARLYSIAVDADANGRGIGRALLAAAEMAALKQGARAMRLEVRAGNRRAAKLYGRNGYQPIGRREAYYEDGADALRLEKCLAP